MRRRAWTLSVLLALAPAAAADSLDAINEGELRILTEEPDKPIPVQTKILTVAPQALRDGWVRNHQCLYNFNWWGDAVQIVFGRDKVRAIEITRSHQIGKAWVEDNTVQLEGITEESELCLVSENRVFERRADGYVLRTGPFMFQLFDGFFPMRLSVRVDYPEQLLRFDGIEPDGVGIDIVSAPGHVRFEAAFEGVLWVTVRFTARRKPAAPVPVPGGDVAARG